MARIRTIKPSFWTDERVCAVPRVVRLTALGLISALCDDEGRAKANPRVVRGAIYPLDDDLSAAEVGEHLDALERVGFIRRYRVNGECYLVVCNFLKHQKIDKPSKSQLPAPPGEPNTPTPDHSPNDRRTIDEQSTSPRDGREGSVGEKLLTHSPARGAVERPEGDDAGRSHGVVPISEAVERRLASASVRWTAAINRGITDGHGEQPVPVRHDAQLESTERVLAAGVDVEWGANWLYHRAKHANRRKLPRSLAYLADGVIEAWRGKDAADEATAAARQFVAGADPSPRGPPNGVHNGRLSAGAQSEANSLRGIALLLGERDTEDPR